MKNIPSVLSVCTLASLFFVSAFASAPQVKTQAPGFYRMMLGTTEITVLFDGFFPIKPKELMVPSIPKSEAALARSYQGELVLTSVNAFLVNTGTKLVLIDAGCGAFFGPSFGQLVENLKASGYSPDQVDEVAITHMHSDHLGGIMRDGKAVFPHATIRMDQADADYWLKLSNAEGKQSPIKEMFANSVAAVAPYQAAKQFKPFHGKTEIVPGITALPSYGHTPGHTSYAVESGGKKLLLVGDLLHVEAIQFPDPSVGVGFDTDMKAATTQRVAAFRDAAKAGYLIGAVHLPFPGIGHVSAEKSGFRYLPIPYGPVATDAK